LIESYKIGRPIIAIGFATGAYLGFFAALVIFFGKDDLIYIRAISILGSVILFSIFYSKIDWFSKQVFEINQE